jgi:hypothetical protein
MHGGHYSRKYSSLSHFSLVTGIFEGTRENILHIFQALVYYRGSLPKAREVALESLMWSPDTAVGAAGGVLASVISDQSEAPALFTAQTLNW